MIIYQIKQSVRSIDKKWSVVVSDTVIERIARSDYEQIIKENPDDYFELIRVEKTETCLAFTAFKG